MSAEGETPAPSDEAELSRRVLGAPWRYNPAELWAAAGMPEEAARALWLALGFPHIPEQDVVLTDVDLDALRAASGMVHDGDATTDSLRVQARIMGQALSTLATARVEELDAPPSQEGLEVFERLLVYVYRRHLLAALTRAAMTEGTGGGDAPIGVVGFADLTGFTAASVAAPTDELTGMVDRFASHAADVVAAAGGRIIKLIGDAVMFALTEPAAAAEVALKLVDTDAAPEEATPVHAGLALGPLVSHHGDLFGPTVNLASRLTGTARPGTILVNDTLWRTIRSDGSYHLRRVRPRRLKGVGSVPAFALRRANEGDRRDEEASSSPVAGDNEP